MSQRGNVEVSSAAAEAFRILRSSVKFAAGDQPIHTVLIVDVDRDEPSGVAEELGAAFARAGDRTVVVLTNSRDHSGPDTGFGDLLFDGTVDALGLQPDADGLAVIPAGRRLQADLLAGDKLSRAIAALREQFDYVIIAAASLPRHSDALGIGPRVDATILAVTSGKTRRARAIEARDALERVGARILGVVMVDGKRRRFW